MEITKEKLVKTVKDLLLTPTITLDEIHREVRKISGDPNASVVISSEGKVDIDFKSSKINENTRNCCVMILNTNLSVVDYHELFTKEAFEATGLSYQYLYLCNNVNDWFLHSPRTGVTYVELSTTDNRIELPCKNLVVIIGNSITLPEGFVECLADVGVAVYLFEK